MANNINHYRGNMYFTPNGRLYINGEPVMPLEEDFGDHNQLDTSYDNDLAPMRRSLSMNDMAGLREQIAKVEFDDSGYSHKQRKLYEAPTELSKTKFVSMAEAIYHYQRDTPGRFHSTRPQTFRSQGTNGRSGLTVPQSPMLRCKARFRPTHVLSQKQKEEMEIEEMKKYKIKANPIPKSVIVGPIHLPEVSRKVFTVPEPFKLTEIQKKPLQSTEIHKFKARPVPKHIFEKADIPVRDIAHPTKDVFSKYNRTKSSEQLQHDIKVEANKKQEEKSHRLGPVKPEPFSFEKRDEELKRRREEKIKQAIEEERKQASQFKAQPIPGVIKKRMQGNSIQCSSSTSSENKENHFKFEAKPPVVLYKEPFKPVLQTGQILKPVPFELTTEKRAIEREKFEKKQKEKEAEQERLRLQREKEQQMIEERERAKLRGKLIHHAKPAPDVVPFIPEKSNQPLTVPETPKFMRRLKQH